MRRNPTDVDAERVREEHLASLALAQRLADEGRYREALTICKRLNADAPPNADVLRLLGLLYARTGELNKALINLAAALLHAQRNPQVLYALAEVYLQAGAPVHALHSLRSYREEWRQLIRVVDLADPDPLMARLVAFMRAEPGVADLAPETQDKAMMAAERGRLRLLFDEDPEKALSDLREAIRHAPRYPQPRNNLSLACFYNAQPDQAITTLETTLREVAPGNVYALASLSFVRWAGGAEPATVQPLLAQAAAGLTAESRLLDRVRVAEVAGALGEHRLAYEALAAYDAGQTAEADLEAGTAEQAARVRLLATALANLDRADEALTLLREAPTVPGDRMSRRLLSAVEGEETLPALVGGGYPYLAWEDLLCAYVLRRMVSPPAGGRLPLRNTPAPSPEQVAARLVATYPRLVPACALLIWMGEPDLENLALALLALVATPEADALLDAHLRGTAGSYSGRQEAGYALLDAGRLPNGAVVPFWSGTAWSEIRLFRLSPQQRKGAALQQSIQALLGRLLESRAL